MNPRVTYFVGAMICTLGLIGTPAEQAIAKPTVTLCESIASELKVGRPTDEASVGVAGAFADCQGECIWLCVPWNEECNRRTCELFGCPSGGAFCLEDFIGCSVDQPDLLICTSS